MSVEEQRHIAEQLSEISDECQRLESLYAVGFEGLIDYVNNLLPKNEHIGAALREDRPLFPGIAVRELVANALIHQDMTITGAGPQIELFEDRLLHDLRLCEGAPSFQRPGVGR